MFNTSHAMPHNGIAMLHNHDGIAIIYNCLEMHKNGRAMLYNGKAMFRNYLTMLHNEGGGGNIQYSSVYTMPEWLQLHYCVQPSICFFPVLHMYEYAQTCLNMLK